MLKLRAWVQHLVEFMAVVLMIAMFTFFLLQIFFRYILNDPLSWTSEACTLTYVWVVFWGGAFLLKHQDHVAFSMVHDAAPPHVKRILTVLFCLGIGGMFVVGLPQVWDYITFMQIDRTPILRIRFDFAYAIFIPFALAVIIRSVGDIVSAIRTEKTTD